MRKVILIFLLLIAAQASYAQYHYKGWQGVFAEYGYEGKFDQSYSVGYSKLFSNKWQAMLNAGYATGNYRYLQSYQYYETLSDYDIESYSFTGTINYSFLRLFKFVYLNAGLGPSVSYQHISDLQEFKYVIDNKKITQTDERYDIRPELVGRESAIKVGALASFTTEIYLAPQLNLLYRYNFKYVFKSNIYDQQDSHNIGLRYNFR